MTRQYKGFNISRFTGRNTSGFRWTAYRNGFGFLHADTLANMRALITATIEKDK